MVKYPISNEEHGITSLSKIYITTIFFIIFIFSSLFIDLNISYNNDIKEDILSLTKLSNFAYSNYENRFNDYENSTNNIVYLNPKISYFGFTYEE